MCDSRTDLCPDVLECWYDRAECVSDSLRVRASFCPMDDAKKKKANLQRLYPRWEDDEKGTYLWNEIIALICLRICGSGTDSFPNVQGCSIDRAQCGKHSSRVRASYCLRLKPRRKLTYMQLLFMCWTEKMKKDSVFVLLNLPILFNATI